MQFKIYILLPWQNANICDRETSANAKSILENKNDLFRMFKYVFFISLRKMGWMNRNYSEGYQYFLLRAQKIAMPCEYEVVNW